MLMGFKPKMLLEGDNGLLAEDKLNALLHGWFCPCVSITGCQSCSGTAPAAV